MLTRKDEAKEERKGSLAIGVAFWYGVVVIVVGVTLGLYVRAGNDPVTSYATMMNLLPAPEDVYIPPSPSSVEGGGGDGPVLIVRTLSRHDIHEPIEWLQWGEEMGGVVDVRYLGLPMKKPACPVRCEVTTDQSRIAEADALVFEPANRWTWWETAYPRFPLALEQPEGSNKDRVTVGVVYEVPSSFPTVANASSDFDWVVSYQRDSDVPISLYCSFGFDIRDLFGGIPSTPGIGVSGLPWVPIRDKIPAAVFMASRCRSADGRARNAYVAQLSRYFPVVSFGQCLHNADAPGEAEGGGQWPRPWTAKVNTLSRYAFTLAFENANITDWITEKPLHAWMAGSIPVVMGARLGTRWSPGPRSHIHVSDFTSPKELGMYLSRLVRNGRVDMTPYFGWRRAEWSDVAGSEFVARFGECAWTADCRLCTKLQTMRSA